MSSFSLKKNKSRSIDLTCWRSTKPQRFIQQLSAMLLAVTLSTPPLYPEKFLSLRMSQDGGLKVMIDHRKSVYSVLTKLPY